MTHWLQPPVWEITPAGVQTPSLVGVWCPTLPPTVGEDMDKNTLFGKTAAGREAMTSRPAGLVPRLRSLLIMVDGKRNLAEFEKLTGSLEQATQSLNELMSGGWVEIVGADGLPKAGAAPWRRLRLLRLNRRRLSLCHCRQPRNHLRTRPRARCRSAKPAARWCGSSTTSWAPWAKRSRSAPKAARPQPTCRPLCPASATGSRASRVRRWCNSSTTELAGRLPKV